MSRAGGRDYDIGALAGFVKPAKLDRLSAKFVRQPDGAVVGAIRDEDRSRAMREQMPSRELAHLPRTHQADALAIQASDDFLGQFAAPRSNRNQPSPPGTFSTPPF